VRCTCSFSFVVMDDGLPDHCLIVKAEHDGGKCVPVVMNQDASSVRPCGVGFVGIDKFLHGVSL